MKLRTKYGLITLAIFLVLAVLSGIVINYNNKTVTFQELVIENVTEGDIRYISFRKFPDAGYSEDNIVRIESEQEIKRVLDRLTEGEFKRTNSTRELGTSEYMFDISGDYKLLYILQIFSNGFVIVDNSSGSIRDYITENDFDFSFLDQYFDE
ncbi:hypothetical protein [Bacillus horti]|uniref:PepSY domain-containing protein n=1 Tax=Caldalkalibacillus horti TaxID=77523 RepID=A0ABT9W297_9BACI|nr:hypothetical protein [Bacillus horti]MDQ0167194.1 hypothetical protein [Bacillus horti]